MADLNGSPKLSMSGHGTEALRTFDELGFSAISLGGGELKVHDRGLNAFNIGRAGLIATDLKGNTTLSFSRQGGSLITAGAVTSDPGALMNMDWQKLDQQFTDVAANMTGRELCGPKNAHLPRCIALTLAGDAALDAVGLMTESADKIMENLGSNGFAGAEVAAVRETPVPTFEPPGAGLMGTFTDNIVGTGNNMITNGLMSADPNRGPRPPKPQGSKGPGA